MIPGETNDALQSNLQTENPLPQRIPQAELVDQALVNFAQQINTGEFTAEDVTKFVEEKVIGLLLNGVAVICMDFEHSDRTINPIAEAFIRSPDTNLVVAEYFYPEIMSNLNRIGKSLLADKMGGGEARIGFSRELSKLCRLSHKSVACTDIASKARYMIFRELFRSFPQYLLSLCALSGVSREILNPLYLPVLVTNISWIYMISASLFLGKGIFDKNKVGALEGLIVDFEQARRFYAARGVEELTKEYAPQTQSTGKKPQIVVMYPKAHGIRIAEHLLHRNVGLEKAKNVIYKLFGPGLDFSVRQWLHNSSLDNIFLSGYQWHDPSDHLSQREPDTPLDRLVKSRHRFGTHIDSDPGFSSDELANWTKFSDRKIAV